MCFDLTRGGEGAANLIIRNAYLEPEVLFASQVTTMITENRGCGAPARPQQLRADSAPSPPTAAHRTREGGLSIFYFYCSVKLHYCSVESEGGLKGWPQPPRGAGLGGGPDPLR